MRTCCSPNPKGGREQQAHQGKARMPTWHLLHPPLWALFLRQRCPGISQHVSPAQDTTGEWDGGTWQGFRTGRKTTQLSFRLSPGDYKFQWVADWHCVNAVLVGTVFVGIPSTVEFQLRLSYKKCIQWGLELKRKPDYSQILKVRVGTWAGPEGAHLCDSWSEHTWWRWAGPGTCFFRSRFPGQV